MRIRWQAWLVAGCVLLLAGAASAAPMSIDWNVTFTTDAGVIALGLHEDAGSIDLDASDDLIRFVWSDVALIDSDVHAVVLSSVARNAGGDVVGLDLFGFNSTNDSLSLSQNGALSNFFSFSAGGVNASGTYSVAPSAVMPEPSAALVFGLGLVVFATRSRRHQH